MLSFQHPNKNTVNNHFQMSLSHSFYIFSSFTVFSLFVWPYSNGNNQTFGTVSQLWIFLYLWHSLFLPPIPNSVHCYCLLFVTIDSEILKLKLMLSCVVLDFQSVFSNSFSPSSKNFSSKMQDLNQNISHCIRHSTPPFTLQTCDSFVTNFSLLFVCVCVVKREGVFVLFVIEDK